MVKNKRSVNPFPKLNKNKDFFLEVFTQQFDELEDNEKEMVANLLEHSELITTIKHPKMIKITFEPVLRKVWGDLYEIEEKN